MYGPLACLLKTSTPIRFRLITDAKTATIPLTTCKMNAAWPDELDPNPVDFFALTI